MKDMSDKYLKDVLSLLEMFLDVSKINITLEEFEQLVKQLKQRTENALYSSKT
jgi:hypothetical protein